MVFPSIGDGADDIMRRSKLDQPLLHQWLYFLSLIVPWQKARRIPEVNSTALYIGATTMFPVLVLNTIAALILEE